MSGIWSAIGRGALAGAAGTTALNAVTYADMAVRARPASSTAEDTVERMARVVGVPIPGDEDRRENRVSGLGPLTGILTGVAVGVAAGLVRQSGVRLPGWLASLALGAAAMLASDAPMTALGVADPKSWGAADWVSDAVPHLVYGAVTHAALTATGS